MPLKILVPVIPTEAFSDAVVAAADLLAQEGGTITFLFTSLRPPPDWEEKEDVGFDAELDADPADLQDEPDDSVEAWQDQMREGLEDSLALLRERGVSDDNITIAFADPEIAPSEAIAGEAAAGAYDMVVLSRGELIEMPEIAAGSEPRAIAEAVQELADDGVKLIVT